MPERGLVLVLDTCGERASVALHCGTTLIAEEILAERTAAKALLQTLRAMLQANALRLERLDGLGVVHGPGSFTGVRVGLALAKGLCESACVRCAPVSRLVVLAQAAGLREGYALLPAGRGQVYAREFGDGGRGTERMIDLAALLPELASQAVAVAGVELADSLRGKVASLRVIELRAQQAILPVLSCLAQGGADPATLDANYVRDEGAIYRKSAVLATAQHG